MNRPRLAPSCFPLLLAAATLSGCASSDRMIRLSPLAPAAAKSAGDAHESRLGARTLTDDRVNAFPLYYAAGGMTSVCWPLADWDERGWAVRPFYNRDGQNQSVLFPLSGWDDSGGWVLNTVWDDRRGRMFAPVFGSWNNTDFVFPVFVTARPGEAEPVVRVFPLWYSDAHETRLDPLYAARHDAAGVTREALFGLLYHDAITADAASRRAWLFPFVFHERDAESSRWWSAPVSAGHDARHAWLNIHPLWWSSSGDGWSRETLFPLRRRTVDGDARAAYTPLGFSRSRAVDAETATWLYSYGHDAERSWLNIHPLWWSSSGAGGSSRLLFPLYYETASAAASGVYTPFGFYERHGVAENTVTWLYSRGRDGESRRFNVHPLWWSWSEDGESSDLLLPVYWRYADKRGATAYTPLGFHEVTGAGDRWLTLPFSAGRAGERSWLNVHPFWWSSDAPGERMRALAPLYYTRSAGDATVAYTPLGFSESVGADRRVVTLPYSAGRAGERSWLNVHPLWWSSDAPDTRMRALFPVYYTQREGAGSDTWSWLGYHGVAGEDTRWVTLPFSAGHAGRRSWLNIHPLWWSSEDGRRTVRTLLPVWSSERLADGSGSVLTPLGYAESGPGGVSRFVNVLGLGYQWERENEYRESGHVLWPLYASARSTAPVDADFAGRFALAARESAPNLDALRVTPLWSSASGPGVSPARDWCHLVSRRTEAGETSTTVTPLVETIANDAGGRWRVTPLVSSAEWQGDTGWRDWLHLVSVRTDEAAASYALTPLCQRRRAPDASSRRLTPLFDVGSGKYAPMSAWTPHLWVRGEDAGKRFWSCTPLAGGMRTPAAESEYVQPFYAYEARDGRTVSRRVFPFYAEGEEDGVADALCVVHHLRTPEKETRSWFGPVWRREIFRAAAAPDERLFSAPRPVLRERTGGLFTSEERADHLSLPESVATAAERAAAARWLAEEPRLRAWETLRLRPDSPEARELREYRRAGTEDELARLHAEVLALLRRQGAAPEVASVDGVKRALARLAAQRVRVDASRRYAVDPLGIRLYHEESDPSVASWTLLFGVGRGEVRDGYGRASVLGYLYTKETAPDGVRMNCFPFIQRDETTARRKVSFLGRVWNRETDRRTGEVRGHVLFVPYRGGEQFSK